MVSPNLENFDLKSVDFMSIKDFSDQSFTLEILHSRDPIIQTYIFLFACTMTFCSYLIISSLAKLRNANLEFYRIKGKLGGKNDVKSNDELYKKYLAIESENKDIISDVITLLNLIAMILAAFFVPASLLKNMQSISDLFHVELVDSKEKDYILEKMIIVICLIVFFIFPLYLFEKTFKKNVLNLIFRTKMITKEVTFKSASFEIIRFLMNILGAVIFLFNFQIALCMKYYNDYLEQIIASFPQKYQSVFDDAFCSSEQVMIQMCSAAIIFIISSVGAFYEFVCVYPGYKIIPIILIILFSALLMRQSIDLQFANFIYKYLLLVKEEQKLK